MIISLFTLNNERERVDVLYSDRESNPDQRFRKPTFYPLNYQSEPVEYYYASVRRLWNNSRLQR